MKSLMKTGVIIISIIPFFVFAQVPQAINYQAIYRDAQGLPQSKVMVNTEIQIIENPPAGPVIYCETASTRTNEYGLFTLEVGKGIICIAGIRDFNEIDWLAAQYYLSIRINGQLFGPPSPIISVPYALTAQKAVESTLAEVAVNTLGEPVGTVKLFWDAGGSLAIPNNWKVMDGSQILDQESPLFGMNLPDMTNRYAVGSISPGTTTILGNVNHQVNLAHNHTTNSHTHSLPNHNHGPGNLRFSSFYIDYDQTETYGSRIYYTGSLKGYNSSGYLQTALYNNNTSHYVNVDPDGEPPTPYMQVNSTFGDETYYTANGTGSTESGGGGTSGFTSPGTDTKLSSTQSIQPESIGLKYIIKIK